MKLLLTERFRRDYSHLSSHLQDQVDHKLQLLLGNPRHPSLRVKKMQGGPNIWELRVTEGYRLTFLTAEGHYILRRVGTHDILRTP